MSSLAEFPDLVKNAFENTDKSESGLYNVRFYIRGKPWTVSIDDYLAFHDYSDPELVAGHIGADGAIWGPLMEKAWAKVKGNYMNAHFDLSANGIRALTGVPVFDYYSDDFSADNDAWEDMWEQILEADKAGYIMSASSNGMAGEYLVNGCGIEMAHSYSVLSAFLMTDSEGYENKMLLVRNPTG